MLDRAGRVALDLACRKCGRNLRGMLPEGPCPECGQSVAHALSETLDVEWRVQSDVACLKCGYNLRTLELDGKCPECGSPVADSVRGDLLEFADPAWVSGLASGATLLLAAGVSAVAAIVYGLLGGLLYGTYPEWKGLLGAVALAFGALGAVAAALLGPAGIVKLTKTETRINLQAERLSAREICHQSLAASALLAFVCVATVVVGGRFVAAWQGILLLMATLIVAFGALPVSLLRHLATLFRRVPNAGHADMAHGLSIGIMIGDGIIAVPLVASLFIQPIGGLAGAALIGVFALAGCGLGLLGVLYYARVDFAKAAERARARGGISPRPGITGFDQTTDDPPED
jgi:Zn finger protein HypA/HybF involved in hydrogenase expression